MPDESPVNSEWNLGQEESKWIKIIENYNAAPSQVYSLNKV